MKAIREPREGTYEMDDTFLSGHPCFQVAHTQRRNTGRVQLVKIPSSLRVLSSRSLARTRLTTLSRVFTTILRTVSGKYRAVTVTGIPCGDAGIVHGSVPQCQHVR